ncbi:MAG: anaerobic ribonucleoside-triphosphate reductase [Candidatus Bathyarchaeota archaeon]|nr:anaerobic ribonucleoside-triphosphate reductase [Candidatus Bathyarchaeota archaeon]
MTVCPECGHTVTVPCREIKNTMFYVALFYCPKCGCSFRVQRYSDCWFIKQ